MKLFFLISTFLVLTLITKATPSDSTFKITPKLLTRSLLIGSDFHGDHLLIVLSTPQMQFKLSKSFQVGPAFFPAFWWNYKTGETETKMGVGVRADYKRLITGFNSFRAGKIWYGSLMIGFKF
jgi:hypothetical protein